MTRLTNWSHLTKNCGSCKWLEVDDSKLTKERRVNLRFNNSAFPCKVPFTVPHFPACFEVSINEKRWSCPQYGTDCAFHEDRHASAQVHRQTPSL
jgi:hypothetical protein